MSRTVQRAVAAVVVSAALSSPVGASATSASTPTPLVGTHWVLSGPRVVGAASADVTVTALFDGTTVSGESGCNTFGGPYTVNGTSIRIGPLNSTLRACADDALNTQEAQYLMALELAASFQVKGNRLDLLRADGGIAVTLEAATR